MDSHTGSDDMHGSKGGKEASKKPKKERDDAADGGKKRKGGGLLSNLFGRKKKAGKKGAEGDEDSGRGSVDSREDATSPTPGDAPGRTSPRLQSGTHSGDHRRHSKTDMFSTDAALRQQQIEAQEVLYRQFGIQQRQPGDQANQLALPKQQPQTSSHNSPQSNLLSPSLTASSSSPGVAHRNVRPGSLIGSPSIPGFEAPELKVLRVFAGDLIASESTFKTVLLGETTTTADLIKQAMQRFHLPSEPGDQKDYYLTVKDAIGDESTLRLDQKPLLVFESMNDDLGRDAIPPSVKRSSVGSVSSISSNLSLHPAVSRLGNGDFSDDTAVKLYINRYPAKAIPDRMLSTIQEDNQLDESDSATIMSPSPRDSQLSGITGPSDVHSAAAHPGRFAARVQIHPADLPDNLVFDPNSNAIIPRQVLHERGLQSPTMSDTFREKVIFFPRNVNVFETIEHALDAFGISDGVVDGGDDVEDKLSKRRSISRVRYTLSIKRQGKGTPAAWYDVCWPLLTCICRACHPAELEARGRVYGASDVPERRSVFERGKETLSRRSLRPWLVCRSASFRPSLCASQGAPPGLATTFRTGRRSCRRASYAPSIEAARSRPSTKRWQRSLQLHDSIRGAGQRFRTSTRRGSEQVGEADDRCSTCSFPVCNTHG